MGSTTKLLEETKEMSPPKKKEYCFGLIHPDGLFNSPLTLLIFCVYVCLFVNNGLLVTLSKKKDGQYNYNTVAVVVIMECSKLVMSITIFSCQESFMTLLKNVKKYFKYIIYYMVPAFFYCLYNNLQFVNLAYYDPTTYYILLQLRVIVTGVVYQIVFKRRLSLIQWGSLIILAIGCVIKELKFGGTDGEGKKQVSFFNYHLLLILVQVFMSCLAGVYTEFLLKKDGGQVPIMVQNFFMYVDSIISNIVLLCLTGGIKDLVKPEGWQALGQPLVLCVIMNISIAGITTSMFLKHLNSIVKLFAASVEILLTAVVCRFLFGTALNAQTVISISLVCGALYLYSYAPMQNPPAPKSSNKPADGSKV
ncbi:UDP-galactose transporter senju-like isoform X2 [Lineus longissimus]|uniref:UDP-galactose transporter senju-like isoform X2 n=1 Tax=Lineus longissimus TaxID=88925 RepID=UPI00315CCC39